MPAVGDALGSEGRFSRGLCTRAKMNASTTTIAIVCANTTRAMISLILESPRLHPCAISCSCHVEQFAMDAAQRDTPAAQHPLDRVIHRLRPADKKLARAVLRRNRVGQHRLVQWAGQALPTRRRLLQNM